MPPGETDRFLDEALAQGLLANRLGATPEGNHLAEVDVHFTGLLGKASSAQMKAQNANLTAHSKDIRELFS